MRGIELKHADMVITPGSLINDFSLVANTEGQFSPYKLITQGITDFGNRIGDKITAKYVDFNVVFDLLANVHRAAVRVLVVVQKHTIPSSEFDNPIDVGPLYQLAAFSNNQRFLNAPRVWDNKSAFVTLYDKILFPSRATGSEASTQEPVLYFRKRIKIPSSCQQVIFHNNQNTINKNQLWIFCLTAQDNEMEVTGSMRVAYTDL